MQTRYRYKLIYTKSGLLKYISHLDLFRLFQRTIRKIDIPVVFSEGFHPKPKIKMGQALKLGVESQKEEIEIILSQEISSKDLMVKLNFFLPKEIQIKNVEQV